MSTVSLTLDEILDLAKKTLLANGCDDETASILADLIMKAERDGSLSHGLFRLPAYVAGLKSGKINGKARPDVKKISPSVIKVLGNNCLAPMVLNKGLPELIKTTKVALFVDPDLEQITFAKELGVSAVEIHTGKYSNLFDSNKYIKELEKIKTAANYCSKIGLSCHAGHGLNYNNVSEIAKINEIMELNVGHFLISHSLYTGLDDTIKKFLAIIKHPK